MLKSWRELVAKKVTVHDDSMDVSFEACVPSFQMNKEYLKRKGLNWEDIVEGRKLLIKGKSGNTDMNLWRLDALDGIALIPKEQ
jgi:hypothetical protein